MKVSIIIPCHNHRAELWDCLNSIKYQQTEHELEVIVVDDASNDNPAAVCRFFGFRCFSINAKNANVARNTGLAAATGEVVIFFDADNVMDPDFVDKHVTPIRDGEADVVYSNRQTVGDNGAGIAAYDSHNKYYCDLEMLRLAPQIDTGCAVRRAVLTDNPWDERLVRYQDWDFHLTQQERGLRYQYLPETLWQYRFSPLDRGNDNRNRTELTDSFARVREKHQLATSSSATVTIILPLMGRYFSIEPVLDCVKELDYPHHNTNILFLDGSNDEDFYRYYLLPFIEQQRGNYNAIACTRTYQNPEHFNYVEDSTGQRARCEAVARVWLLAGQHLTTPFAFILEDDTLCPPDALSKLVVYLESNPNALLAQGVLRTRENKYALCAWNFKSGGNLTNLFYRQIEAGVEAIGAGGFFCTLVRRELMSGYPFTAAIDLPNGSIGGPDIACGFALREIGYLWLMDWSIRCEHLTVSGGGRVYNLSLNHYNEPTTLFSREYLPEEMYEDVIQGQDSSPTPLEAQVIIHGATHEFAPESWLKQAGLPNNTELVLVKEGESILFAVNNSLKAQAATTYIVIARADIIPPGNLGLILQTQLSKEVPVIYASMRNQLFTDGANLFLHAKQGQRVLPHLDFVAVMKTGRLWPPLAPASSQLLEYLGWAQYLAKNKLANRVIIGWAPLAKATFFQANRSGRQFWRLGRYARCNFTRAQAYRFYRATVRANLSANIIEQLYWLVGYLF